MNGKLICVGKIKESSLKGLISEYTKRLKRYISISEIEIKEYGSDDSREKAIKKESDTILEKLSADDYVILLDVNGSKMTSEKFSELLVEHKNFLSMKMLTFIIGGSYGVSDTLKQRADVKLSFSDMTFSHQIFRVLFLEQLYRGYNIAHDGKYHK